MSVVICREIGFPLGCIPLRNETPTESGLGVSSGERRQQVVGEDCCACLWPEIKTSVLPVPDFAQETFHVDGFAVHFDHPGVLEHAPGSCAAGGFFLETTAVAMRGLVSVCCYRYIFRHKLMEFYLRGRRGVRIGNSQQHVPTFDEILETLAPLHALAVLTFSRLLVLKLRDWLPNDVGEEVNEARSRLHLGAVGWEGEAVLRHFEKGHA